MSGAERRKGREGELESRKPFEQAGHVVTPIQAGRRDRKDSGDYTVGVQTAGGKFVLVVDSKRRNKVRVLEWARAIEDCAQDGEVPVIVWRSDTPPGQPKEPWRVTLLQTDLLRLLAR